MPRVSKNTTCCSMEAFIMAAASGNVEKLRRLNYTEEHLLAQRTFSPPQLEIYTNRATPLHVAAELGHLGIVKFLLAELEAVNKLEAIDTEDGAGLTSLYKAAKNNHSEVILVLLEKGADPNKRDYNGYGPLYFAIQNGNKKTVKHLLDLGASTKARYGRHNYTALHSAAISKHPNAEAIVKLLLYQGASPYAKDGKYGPKPEAMDEKNASSQSILSWWDRPPKVYGYYKGITPAELALKHSNKAIVKTIQRCAAAFCLLKYARDILELKKSPYLQEWPNEIFGLISDYLIKADTYLKANEIDIIYEYANTTATIDRTRKDFLRHTLFAYKAPFSQKENENNMSVKESIRNKF